MNGQNSKTLWTIDQPDVLSDSPAMVQYFEKDFLLSEGFKIG